MSYNVISDRGRSVSSLLFRYQFLLPFPIPYWPSWIDVQCSTLFQSTTLALSHPIASTVLSKLSLSNQIECNGTAWWSPLLLLTPFSSLLCFSLFMSLPLLIFSPLLFSFFLSLWLLQVVLRLRWLSRKLTVPSMTWMVSCTTRWTSAW